MQNPYDVLDLPNKASPESVKKAYRALAKKYHPDLNPAHEEKFKKISAAYNFLSNSENKLKFDRGEIDASGNPKFSDNLRYSKHGSYNSRSRNRPDDMGGFDADDLFSDLFGASRRKQQRTQPKTGADETYTLSIHLEDAALGGKQTLRLNSGKAIAVTIPAAAEDGQTLRLKGQGAHGLFGGKSGDALVKLRIVKHPYFTLKEGDVHLDLPISLDEAVLGAVVTVPTLHGKVSLKIPKSANSGMLLRLKGKGVGTGRKATDQICTLKVILPEKPDKDLVKLAEKVKKFGSYVVRAF